MLGLIHAQQTNVIKTNDTNPLNYPFQPYSIIKEVRTNGNAFLQGANSTYYSANASNCWNKVLNLAQYDTDLLIVKWIYGNTTENVLNFTLYLQNVSDTSYTCIDAAKNYWVWTIYKTE